MQTEQFEIVVILEGIVETTGKTHFPIHMQIHTCDYWLFCSGLIEHFTFMNLILLLIRVWNDHFGDYSYVGSNADVNYTVQYFCFSAEMVEAI